MSPAFATAAASARMAMAAAGARAGGFGMRRRRSAHESSDVLGPAGGAFRNVGTANQRLKDRAALFAFIFVNRHCHTMLKTIFTRRVRNANASARRQKRRQTNGRRRMRFNRESPLIRAFYSAFGIYIKRDVPYWTNVRRKRTSARAAARTVTRDVAGRRRGAR